MLIGCAETVPSVVQGAPAQESGAADAIENRGRTGRKFRSSVTGVKFVAGASCHCGLSVRYSWNDPCVVRHTPERRKLNTSFQFIESIGKKDLNYASREN